MTATKQVPAGQDTTIPHWDAVTHEWRTITVLAEPVKRTRTRRTTRQAPSVRPPLASDGNRAPIPPWWQDTAYAPMGPLADMRTYVKPAAIATHRPAVIMAGPDLGDITVTR